uniref:Peptidase S1 domain-containing protein n=1 Tax=Globodera rostochiensis TaxID=31243 RepID=A0A914GRV8_GLORO
MTFLCNYFSLIFMFGFLLFNRANGTNELANADPPTTYISLFGKCRSSSFCYKSELFGGNKRLSWKVSRRFRFDKMFSGRSKECGKNAWKIQISISDSKVIVGNESFSINKTEVRGTETANFEFNLRQILENTLMIGGAELKFGQQFSEQLKFGPFLSDFAGLWLLGVDIVPRLGQMPTKIAPLAPAECKLCAVKQRPKNCVSFNTTNAHHLAGGNPLISGGGQIDIGIMPWAVHISIEVFFNTTLNEWTKRVCTGSLISPEFVLTAAHCFINITEGQRLTLAFNSNSSVIAQKSKGFNISFTRQSNSNVFIHHKFDSKNMIGRFDLALIKLKDPICGPIYPICIHCGLVKKFRRGSAIIAGWGKTHQSATKTSKELVGRFAQLTDCKGAKNKNITICIEGNTALRVCRWQECNRMPKSPESGMPDPKSPESGMPDPKKSGIWHAGPKKRATVAAHCWPTMAQILFKLAYSLASKDSKTKLLLLLQGTTLGWMINGFRQLLAQNVAINLRLNVKELTNEVFKPKRADRVWPIASGQSRLAIRVLGPVRLASRVWPGESQYKKETRLARRDWPDATGLETRMARRDRRDATGQTRLTPTLFKIMVDWEMSAAINGSQLRPIKFSKVECYANDNRAAGMGDLASPGGFWIPANYGQQNNTHTVLEVLCKCSSCGHEVHVTHERMGPGELRKEFGQYTNIYSSKELTGINATAYEDIDNVFSEMGGDYENSKCWTNDLIERLRSLSKTGINTTAYEDTDNLFGGTSTGYNSLYKNCKSCTNDLLMRFHLSKHHK